MINLKVWVNFSAANAVLGQQFLDLLFEFRANEDFSNESVHINWISRRTRWTCNGSFCRGPIVFAIAVPQSVTSYHSILTAGDES